jgi:hypothetical protein
MRQQHWCCHGHDGLFSLYHTVNLFPHVSASWTASFWLDPAHTGFWTHVAKKFPSHTTVLYSLGPVATQHAWSATCSPRRPGGGGASVTERAGIDAEPLKREAEDGAEEALAGMVPEAVAEAAIPLQQLLLLLAMTAMRGRAELAFMACDGCYWFCFMRFVLEAGREDDPVCHWSRVSV